MPWLVKYSAAMVKQSRRGPDGKTANELRKGRTFARALPHFARSPSSPGMALEWCWRVSAEWRISDNDKTNSDIRVCSRVSDSNLCGKHGSMKKLRGIVTDSSGTPMVAFTHNKDVLAKVF